MPRRRDFCAAQPAHAPCSRRCSSCRCRRVQSCTTACDWRPARQHQSRRAVCSPCGRCRCGEPPEAARARSGRWSMWATAPAMPTAARALVFARQTRLSLNQEMTRVEPRAARYRELLRSRVSRHANTPGLIVARCRGARGCRSSSPRFPPPIARVSLFIVDPLGNLVMRFDVREGPKGLLHGSEEAAEALAHRLTVMDRIIADCAAWRSRRCCSHSSSSCSAPTCG